MEKKVYEGYKRTSSSAKSTTTKSSAAKKTTTRTSTRKPSASLAGRSSVAKPRLAMFIDVDNAGITRENLLEILFYANGKYKIELCKLYGFSDDTLPGIRDFANEYNVTTVGRMQFKQSGVNCLDSRLLVDAYECALNNKNKIDMIFVWCYPCDLENLFEKIVKLGINTATIDNSIFDCKNKFVSQTFKLYSPYNFTVEQTTYGKVKNEPSNITPSTNIESAPVTSKPVASVTEAPQKTSIFDEVVPPVLPRRTILERSEVKQPQKTATEVETTVESSDNKPTSLVEEIARKLNLDLPEDNDADGDGIDDDEQKATSDIFMNMLKQAGFDDLLNDEKPLNYEDTIGDL